MNISPISTTGTATPMVNAHQASQIKQDFTNIAKAIASGSTADAQAAYAQLTKDAPNLTRANSAIGTKVKALGQAINSGNLTAAQTALTNIQQSGGKHHPHHSGGVSATGVTTNIASSPSGAPSAATAASTPQETPLLDQLAAAVSFTRTSSPTSGAISDIRQLVSDNSAVPAIE